ncbi:spinster family MFS transporter [Flavisphingomonas formosensis]|uniref:spinster family MFS transporter n=1 Tax=Flavisphingomonas formosensis TaxID=861534 RepID=UPI0012F7761E|nr:MFS transporter [Sphingomonas formosensis]
MAYPFLERAGEIRRANDKAGSDLVRPENTRIGVLVSDLHSSPSRKTSDVASAYSPIAAWTSLAILLLLSMISILDRQIIALMVEPIKRDLRLSDTELGLLQGFAFALFYSIASIPLGWAVDRYPRKIIIYFAVTTWSLSAAACGLASSFWQLFFGRTMVGVGEASLTPASVSLISDLFPPEKVGTPMGIYAAGFYLGSGVALGVGGLVVSLFVGSVSVSFPVIGDIASWQAVFLVTGLPGFAFAFLALLLRDPRPPRRAAAHRKSPVQGFGAYLTGNWSVVVYSFGAFGLASLVAYAMGAWTPAYFARTFGWQPGEIGWVWGLVVALSGAAGAVMGGMLIDRVNRAGVRDACLIVPAGSSLIAWPLVTMGYIVASPLLAILSLGFGMVALGVVSAGSFSTWQRIAPPSLRGRVSACFVLVSSLLGAGTGPVVVAFITDYILRDERLLGQSLAWTMGLAIPAMAMLLVLGRSACANGIRLDFLPSNMQNVASAK